MHKLMYHDIQVSSIPMPELETVAQIRNLEKKIKLSKELDKSYATEIEEANEVLHKLKTENVLNPSTELIEKIQNQKKLIEELFEQERSEVKEPLELAPIESAIAELNIASVLEATEVATIELQKLEELHKIAVQKYLEAMENLNQTAKDLLECEAIVDKSTRGLHYGSDSTTANPARFMAALDLFEGARHIGMTDDFKLVTDRLNLWNVVKSLINGIKSSPKDYTLQVRDDGFFFLNKNKV